MATKTKKTRKVAKATAKVGKTVKTKKTRKVAKTTTKAGKAKKTRKVAKATRKKVTKTKWTKKDIRHVVQNLAIATGHKIVHLTKNTNVKSTGLSRWMDMVDGAVRGPYHRIDHGHDFIANVGKVYDEFGRKGVVEFPAELAKDLITPNGIPLPGAQHATKSGLVSSKQATDWLSFNIGDIAVSGLAVHQTYKLYKTRKKGRMNRKDIIWASVASLTKLTAGVSTSNPVLIVTGVIDGIIVLSNLEQAEEFCRKYFPRACKVGVSLAAGTLLGGATAAATTATIAAIGTASTGTAIATLSGAAASKATLAAIGGGSLASGGLGVAGGVAILSGGALLVGGVAAYGLYKFFK